MLFEDDRFVAVPSLGAFVPGWLLIVPKQHYMNLAEMGPGGIADMWRFVDSFRESWEREFGAVIAFEHGPAAAGRLAGCGVDHAHLHVVPFTHVDLAKAAPRRLDDLSWRTINGLADLEDASAMGVDYLYICTHTSQVAATSPRIESQVLRRVIAETLGCADRYNWREYPNRALVEETIERAAGL